MLKTLEFKKEYLITLEKTLDKTEILRDNKKDKIKLSSEYLEEKRETYKPKIIREKNEYLSRVIKHLNREKNQLEIDLFL